MGDLLAVISERAGVTLRADLSVRDDRVVAFTPARPLCETLQDLAALFNDSWQKEQTPDGKIRYSLVRRLSAQHYEDDLEDRVRNRVLAQLEAQVAAANDTPAELAKRPATDPIRKNLENPVLHGRAATRLYALLSREQRNALFASGNLNIAYTTATPQQQQQLKEAFTEVTTTLKAIDEKQRAEFPDVHIVIDTPDILERHGLRFHLTHTNNAGLSALVVQVILGENTYMTMGSFGSDAQWLLPAHGNPYAHKSIPSESKNSEAKNSEAELSKTELSKAVLPKQEDLRKTLLIDSTANPNGTIQNRDQDKDQNRETKETREQSKTWIDRLSALSSATHAPVLADLYRSPAIVHALSAPAKAPETPIDTLDAFCLPTGYLWWVKDGTLLFRKRDWYAQRRYEVSDRWMREMQRRLRRQQGVPTYAELSQLLELTPKQIAGLNGALGNQLETEKTGDATKAVVDLDTQPGLTELLTLVQATMEPYASLPVSQSEADASRQRLSLRSPSQQQLLLASNFLNTMRQPTTPETVHDLSALIYCDPPASQLQNLRQKNLQVHLDWSIDPANAKGRIFNVMGKQWTVWLPLQIPGDRTANTKIELQAE